MLPRVVEDGVRDSGAVVRDHHLLEEAPEHLAASRDGARIVERSLAQELREEIRRALNGTCDKLRKEADECEERHRVARRPHLPSVDVDRVGERLERVEGYSHRKDHSQRMDTRLHPCPVEQRYRLVNEEIAVFEVSEYAQIHRKARSKKQLRRPAFPATHLDKSYRVRPCGNERNQQKESPVPPSIEHVARDNDNKILRPHAIAHRPVDGECGREEKKKRRGIEKHRAISPPCRQNSGKANTVQAACRARPSFATLSLRTPCKCAWRTPRPRVSAAPTA